MRAGKASRRGMEQLGASSTNPTGGATTLQFQDRSLIVGFGYVDGATRIQVDFSGDYRSCTATVAHGKASGSQTYLFKSGGKTYEIQSCMANGIRCAITDDNVLAR